MGHAGLFLFIFSLFKQTSIHYLQQINVKNVHPVYGAEIWTHDHYIVSYNCNEKNTYFFKMGQPQPLFRFIISLFKQTIQFLQ